MVRDRGRNTERASSDVVQIRVMELWSELLNSSEVNANSDFFELGGHSLLAMRLIARINSEFSVSLPWVVFLREPTVGALVAAIKEAS